MKRSARVDQPGVVYRDIPGFPGYQIGSDGSPWSGREKIGEWRPLSVFRRPYGNRYCVVCLRPGVNGRVHCRYVHRLVLEAFVGPCPEGMVACHNDGDTSNNAAGNLRWGTVAANLADQLGHGTKRRGSRSHNTKHNELDVLAVYLLRRSGFTVRSIGAVLGMRHPTVASIIQGKSWKHVNRFYQAMSVLFDQNRLAG